MKWSRAVAHLEGLADACADMAARSHPFAVLPVVALWAYGEVLGPPRDLEVVTVALAVDLPEVGWLSEPPGAQHWAAATRMARNPVLPVWRSAHAPVWNHAVDRPLLLWDLADGRRDAALQALRDGAAGPLRLPAPTPEERRGRRQADLDVAVGVLRATTAEYDARRWSPGKLEPYADALWRAGRGYLDLLDDRSAAPAS